MMDGWVEPTHLKSPPKIKKKKTNPLSKERSWCIEKTAWSFKVAIILPPSKIQVRKRKGNFPKFKKKTCPLLPPWNFALKLKKKKHAPYFPHLIFCQFFCSCLFSSQVASWMETKYWLTLNAAFFWTSGVQCSFFDTSTSLVRGVDGVQFFEQIVHSRGSRITRECAALGSPAICSKWTCWRPIWYPFCCCNRFDPVL